MARLDFTGTTEIAFTAGLEETLFNLGVASAAGHDGEPDLVAAHKWFNLAASRGHSEAVERRRELAIEMTTTEIAEAQRAARDWLRAH